MAVTLTFTTFELEGDETGNGQCKFNYVTLYDGANATAPLLGTFCDNALPEPAVAQSGSMYVKFVADGVYYYKGFKAVFAAIPIVGKLNRRQVPNMAGKETACMSKGFLAQGLEGGGPDPTFPLLFYENPASHFLFLLLSRIPYPILANPASREVSNPESRTVF